MQPLQPQIQYQLSEHILLFVTDLCQSLINCSLSENSLKKILRPFTQAQDEPLNLICKFLRIQISPQTYAALEPKLLYCCIMNT